MYVWVSIRVGAYPSLKTAARSVVVPAIEATLVPVASGGTAPG